MFISEINIIVNNLLSSVMPKEIYCIQIDNWFDHKWLGFSGKGVVKFDGYPWIDSALDEFRQDKTTFPPFTPSRIVDEDYYLLSPSGSYDKASALKLVHEKEHRSSDENLHRRVSDFSDSAIFVWYSSNTLTNHRASLMVYVVIQKTVTTWFASFVKAQTWKLNQTKGIERKQILSLAT